MSILTGSTRQSINSSGGIKKVYFAVKSDVEGTNTDGVVAFTTGALADFSEYIPTKRSSNAVETYTGTPETGQGVYDQVITLMLHKQDTTKRNDLVNLAINELVAIVIDQNDNNQVYGLDNGMDLTANVATTGTVGGDINGYALTFTAQESVMAGSVADTFFV